MHLFAFRSGSVATNARVAKFKRERFMFTDMCGVLEIGRRKRKTNSERMRGLHGCFDVRLADATRRHLVTVMNRRARLSKGRIIEIPRRMCGYALCIWVGLCISIANSIRHMKT